MKKLYISPTGKSKFSFNSYFVSEPPNEEIYIEATQEMINGLKAHTLCWENGQVVSYTKTTEEIAKEESKLKRQEVQREINILKSKLRDSDYKAIKFAEGELSEEEYAPTKLERKTWRVKINELEAIL